MSNLSTLPKGDSAWLLRKAIERIIQQVSVLETNIGSSTTGNSANTQIIFNDDGTLRGDAGLVYNKTTDALTVAGLVTAGSAAITGDLTVRTNTLKVDSTNNRVGIGTATPATRLDVNGGTGGIGGQTHATFSGTAGRGLVISTRSDNTSADRSGVFDAPFTGGTLAFQTLSTDRMVIDASANVNITSGNVVMATSGKGIDFGATNDGSGTRTSELLNDYEEGVFDAFFITGGGTVTINPASNQCRYTKIGRLVTVQGNIAVSSVSSPTGPLLISGLPYTIAAGTEGDSNSAMSVMAQGLQATATGQIVGYGVAGSVSIYMYRYEAGAIIGLAPSAKAGSEFAFSMTYSV